MVHAGVESSYGFKRNLARTILVVEDEEIIRTCVSELLRDCGYQVFEAGDVAEAKDALVQQPVDVVFSDVNMPNRQTGFALEKWVRQHFPGIKVLLTSGFPQVAEDTCGLLEPVIAKPYGYAELLRRIEAVLQPANGSVEQARTG